MSSIAVRIANRWLKANAAPVPDIDFILNDPGYEGSVDHTGSNFSFEIDVMATWESGEARDTVTLSCFIDETDVKTFYNEGDTGGAYEVDDFNVKDIVIDGIDDVGLSKELAAKAAKVFQPSLAAKRAEIENILNEQILNYEKDYEPY